MNQYLASCTLHVYTNHSCLSVDSERSYLESSSSNPKQHVHNLSTQQCELLLTLQRCKMLGLWLPAACASCLLNLTENPVDHLDTKVSKHVHVLRSRSSLKKSLDCSLFSLVADLKNNAILHTFMLGSSSLHVFVLTLLHCAWMF